ncbi:MAG: pyridoxamine 5'-phosphate oxidase family protein [Roseiflexaceae bacterium]|nr:pyridoxamine 5'-phosphate oxidase family protein [Roseiflexaceae bacterium]
MKPDELRLIAALLLSERVAALGTLRNGGPFTSLVAFAPEAGFNGFLLHLSSLSPHTQQLTADPRAALLIAERDDSRDDPQTLARITILGTAVQILPTAPDHAAAKAIYLARLPAAAMLFDFADFSLFRLIPCEARYVGGFARAFTLSVEQLQQAAVTK